MLRLAASRTDRKTALEAANQRRGAMLSKLWIAFIASALLVPASIRLRAGVSGQGGAHRHPVLARREQRPHRARSPAASHRTLEAAGASSTRTWARPRRSAPTTSRRARPTGTRSSSPPRSSRTRPSTFAKLPYDPAERSRAGHARHRLAADDRRAPVAAGEQPEGARRVRPRPPRASSASARRGTPLPTLLLLLARQGEDGRPSRTRAPGRSTSTSWADTCRSASAQSARCWGRCAPAA